MPEVDAQGEEMKEEFETYADALWWGLVSHPWQIHPPPPTMGMACYPQREGQLPSAVTVRARLPLFPILPGSDPTGCTLEQAGFPSCL